MTADILWFVTGLRGEIPVRMVSRDLDDDGSPALAAALEAYITDGEPCYAQCRHDHWSKTSTDLWNDLYMRPFKRALGIVALRPVPKGRPALHIVLKTLARHDGNVDMTVSALAADYAFMASPAKARRWIGHALWMLRTVYREDAPSRELRRKSEAQLDAMAAKEAA